MFRYYFLFLIILKTFCVSCKNSTTVAKGVQVSLYRFKPYKKRILDKTPIAINRVQKHLECIAACSTNRNCASVNVLHNDAGYLTCQILQEDKHSDLCSFIWSEHSTHYAFASECTKDDSVCQDPFKKCVPDIAKQSYQCVEKEIVSSEKVHICPTEGTHNGLHVLMHKVSFCWYCDTKFSKGSLYALLSKTNDDFFYNRTWEEYKNGFGVFPSYFIGNDMLHKLTRSPVTATISGIYEDGRAVQVTYTNFTIGSEKDEYVIRFSSPVTIIDSNELFHQSLSYQNGAKFSTFDHGDYNADARKHGTGGWFNENNDILFFTHSPLYNKLIFSKTIGRYFKQFALKLDFLVT